MYPSRWPRRQPEKRHEARRNRRVKAEKSKHLFYSKCVTARAAGNGFTVVPQKRAGLSHVKLLGGTLNPKELVRCQGVNHNFDLATGLDQLGELVH